MQDRYSEQRSHERLRVPVRVEVSLESGILVEGKTINISLGGILFETEFVLPLCCPVKVVLSIDGKESEHKIECQGIVARLDEHGVAIMFSHITAANSFYLHRLLYSSLGSGDEVDSIFAAAGNAEMYY